MSTFIFGKSGVMMDNFDYGVPLLLAHIIKDCGEESAWTLFAKARREGVNDFVTDLGAAVISKYKERYTRYSGALASFKESKSLETVPNTQFIGVAYNSRHIKGGNIYVKKIGLLVDTPGNYDAYIVDLDTGDISAPYTIPVTASGKKGYYVFATPLILPLVDGDDAKRYAVVYEPAGAIPFKVKDYCKPCTGGDAAPFDDYVYTSKVTGTSTTDLTVNDKNRYASGIWLETDILCSPLGFLCRTWDFNNDPWSKVMAKAIMFYSVNKLIGYLLDHSRKIDITHLMDREKWYGKRNHARKEASDRIFWLADNIPVAYNDCLDCRKNQPRKKPLLM